jgi:hypothetical protein
MVRWLRHSHPLTSKKILKRYRKLLLQKMSLPKSTVNTRAEAAKAGRTWGAASGGMGEGVAEFFPIGTTPLVRLTGLYIGGKIRLHPLPWGPAPAVPGFDRPARGAHACERALGSRHGQALSVMGILRQLTSRADCAEAKREFGQWDRLLRSRSLRPKSSQVHKLETSGIRWEDSGSKSYTSSQSILPSHPQRIRPACWPSG